MGAELKHCIGDWIELGWVEGVGMCYATVNIADWLLAAGLSLDQLQKGVFFSALLHPCTKHTAVAVSGTLSHRENSVAKK